MFKKEGKQSDEHYVPNILALQWHLYVLFFVKLTFLFILEILLCQLIETHRSLKATGLCSRQNITCGIVCIAAFCCSNTCRGISGASLC